MKSRKINTQFFLSLSEILFIIIFLLFIVLYQLNQHFDQYDLLKEETKNSVILPKEDYNSMISKKEKLKKKIEIIEGKNDKLSNEVLDAKENITSLHNQINALDKERTKINNELEKYKNRYGFISDIPPDCSKTDLIDSYLFESVMISEKLIHIKGEEIVINISQIPNKFSKELKEAKEKNCIHKVKLLFDGTVSAGLLSVCEEKLQRYFYVVKEEL